MFKIHARKRCCAAVSKYYPAFALKSDTLLVGGFYRAFFEIPEQKILESVCDNIFNRKSEIRMYEAVYINRICNTTSNRKENIFS